jgi:hypothetical protein
MGNDGEGTSASDFADQFASRNFCYGCHESVGTAAVPAIIPASSAARGEGGG